MENQTYFILMSTLIPCLIYYNLVVYASCLEAHGFLFYVKAHACMHTHRGSIRNLDYTPVRLHCYDWSFCFNASCLHMDVYIKALIKHNSYPDTNLVRNNFFFMETKKNVTSPHILVEGAVQTKVLRGDWFKGLILFTTVIYKPKFEHYTCTMMCSANYQ